MSESLHERHLLHAVDTLKERTHPDIDDRTQRLQDVVEKQEWLTTFAWGDLGAGPGNLFVGGIHLPFGKPISSFYVENHGSTAVLTVSFGSNATGYGVLVNHGTGKRMPCPEHVTSISVSSNVADTGAVLVVVSSRLWSPATNTTI